MITERQEKILDIVIQEYVKSARPISSKFLEEKYFFGICPATIRIEMQKLTDAGFISQPHTSAGRVPTDKGYRFFVDNLLGKEFLKSKVEQEIEDWIKDDGTSSIKLLQSAIKNLSLASSNLILGYLFNQKILLKEGWAGIAKEPEFSEKENINNFIQMIDAFEEEIEESEFNISMDFSVKVYIGKEVPFSKAKEFSIIATNCHFLKEENGFLAILGPKRMNYGKNISSLSSLAKLLDKI